MTLQELNNQIHAVRDKSEMLAKLATFKANIKTALVAGESDSYYKNHTGREFYKKLNNFGMSPYSIIGDPHDAGFRPLTTTVISL